MSDYGTSIDGNMVRILHEDFANVSVEFSTEEVVDNIAVRMVSKGHRLWNFVDDEGEVDLYVLFKEGFSGIPWDEASNSKDETAKFAYKVELAGKMVRLEPLLCIKSKRFEIFKATAKIGSSNRDLLQAGKPVPFSLQYVDGDRKEYEVNSVTEPNRPVYYQPVWHQLNERDKSLRNDIDKLENRSSIPWTSLEETTPAVRDNSLEHKFLRSDTPVQLAKDDYFLYYTRKACSPFIRSQNPFVRFIKELMVTPLTNVTGLSLYYQLYLVEIFHVKFFTKAGHYLCMPLIVLLMATWFAQWRFIGHYEVQNFGVLIFNGTAVFLIVLEAWYLVWGFLYRMYFGIFMIYPLLVIYILGNLLFQMIVINSMWIHDSLLSIEDLQTPWGQNSTHWYDCITLSHFGVVWYLHPLVWALVFSAFQALSHIFEDKLPPRVSQTAHWMDLTTVLKNQGIAATSVIVVSQFFFGTINEFLASPRLLPLLVLRLCYTIGYEEVSWMKFRLLVDKCLKYGDPAIDYIGKGGALEPDHFEEFKPEHMVNKVRDIEAVLTKEQKERLKDPAFLKEKCTTFLQYYIRLRHRLTRYEIQCIAYGPFTPKVVGDEMPHQKRMMNDFPDNPAFRMFLEEARSHFSEMEWRFLNECNLEHF